MKKKLHRFSLHVGRWTWYAGAAVLLLLSVAVTAARFMLPQLVEHKDEIEAAVNRVSPRAVRLGKLTTYWDGLYPGLHAEGVEVMAADRSTPVLRLREVRVSLAWLPLLRRQFEIHSLEVTGASLVFERLADGRYRLAGFHPVQPTDEGQGEAFLQWLFRQNRLAILDSELTWRDARDAGKPLKFTHVNLTLRNQGERHHLGASAVFPPQLCRECSLVADVSGNPFESGDWSGQIYLRASGLDMVALPRIARERLPAELAGRLDVRLWTRWEGGQLRRVEGPASASGLRLPLKGLSVPLTVREIKGDVDWKADDRGWRLELGKLELGLTQPAWSADYLRFDYRADEKALEVGHVNLGDLTAFVDGMREQHELLRRWSEIHPEGALNKLKLKLVGEWDAPRDYSLSAELDSFGLRQRAAAPGVRGLSGRLDANADSGKFYSDSEEISLALPEVFRRPLVARQARGWLAWKKNTEDWTVTGEQLRLTASDGEASGEFALHVPHDAARSPTLRIEADFRNLNGAEAARYYPVKHLSRSTLEWMEQSFIGGRITKGRLLYDGPTRAFPFADGSGRFEIRGHVRDGIYSYLPGWEPVRKAEVDVVIDRDQVRVTGEGRIGALVAKDVVVQTQRAPDGEEISVRAGIAGPVAETLRVLYGIRPGSAGADWTRYLPGGLQGAGDGALTLDVRVPLGPSPVRVAGEYRFRKASLREPATGAAAEKLDGFVHFGDDGLREGQLRGRLLGGEATWSAAQHEGRLQMRGQGRIAPEGLASVLGPRVAPHVSGGIPWSAGWSHAPKGGALAFELGLQELMSRLPAPLNYPNGLPVERLTVRTESTTADNHVLAVSAGSRVGGRLLFQRQGGAWQFVGGRVGFGEERLSPPRGRGLHLSAQLDALDLDEWFPLLGQEGARETPSWLARVSADVRALELLDRPFGRIAIDLMRDKDAWSGTVSGANAGGRMRYARRGATTQVDFDLNTLTLPAVRETASAGPDTDPRRLPALTVRSKSFQLRDMPLGELDFVARPTAAGWHVARLNLTRPESQLAVAGDWRSAGNAHASEFDVRLTSSDIGKTLAAIGLSDQMAGGELKVVSHLTWPAAPAKLRLALLSGNAEITAEKGRFLQLKQGAGRLFGILDLSAIGRYLTLDFSPIFGQGFVYDRIHSKATLERGNVYTDDLSLRGPSAKMNVRGRIGLAAEDFDLTMNVQPQLTDSLTIGSLAVFGPQVAATVLALQKLFKKEITETTRVSYVVKGPWDNPTVTRTLQEGNKAASGTTE